MSIRVKTSSFTRLKTTDFTDYAQRNVNAVSARPDLFSGIFPSVQVVQDAVVELRAITALSRHGTRAQKNKREKLRTIFTSYLNQWTGFIMMIANREATRQLQIALVEAAAFHPAYCNQNRSGSLSAVTNVRTKSLSKAVLVTYRRVRGARSYVVMKTAGYASEQSIWTEVEITTRCKVIIPCKPAEVVSLMIRPIGKNGIGPNSAIVTCLAGL